MKLTLDNVKKETGKFEPKAVLILVDELSEVMNDTNYKMVSSIQNSLGSIARLGRAAGVHLCLATQRPSSNVINADLKNNIQMGVLLGDFDTGASTLIFDEDISDLAKPEIKGRGFIKTGKDINEFQSYWTEKEKDFLLRDGTYMKMEENKKDKSKNKKKKNKTISVPELTLEDMDAKKSLENDLNQTIDQVDNTDILDNDIDNNTDAYSSPETDNGNFDTDINDFFDDEKTETVEDKTISNSINANDANNLSETAKGQIKDFEEERLARRKELLKERNLEKIHKSIEELDSSSDNKHKLNLHSAHGNSNDNTQIKNNGNLKLHRNTSKSNDSSSNDNNNSVSSYNSMNKRLKFNKTDNDYGREIGRASCRERV